MLEQLSGMLVSRGLNFPGGSVVKNRSASVRDAGSVP